MLIASVIFVLGVVVNGVDINYATSGAGIRSFSYTASNPDASSGQGPYEFLGSSDTECAERQTDDDFVADTGGCIVTSSDVSLQYSWGKSGAATTKGMVGEFYAMDVQPGTNPATGNPYSYYTITKVAISFRGVSCIPSTSDATFYYTRGGSSVVNTIEVDASSANGITTFEADVSDANLKLLAGEDIGFEIETNTYCEAGMHVVEFELEGVPAETAEPTKSPSNKPTTPPTTATPTMAPTGQCNGEVTWGDPHMSLMSAHPDKTIQFNYQELGWFFYLAPCDMSLFEHWPFFILSYHTRCYWKGNPKGCINDNKLILNTKPNPWVIQFNYRNLEITKGSDDTLSTISSNALKSNGQINTKKNYRSSDPLVIEYNDGKVLPTQAGKLKIFYDGDVIVLQLFDVQYDGLPRSCNKLEGRGERFQCGTNVCPGLVIDIRNRASWTYFTCPPCLRNIACGMMGKYYRGDCTQSQMGDPTNECSKVLVGSNGVVYTDSQGRAWGDTAYGQMADTWAYDYVKSLMQNTHSYAINFAKEKNTIFKHEKKKIFPQGRSLHIEDASFYDGYCKNNLTHIAIVNETCRQSTVVQYERCCKEIGFCEILWAGCIEDYCSCTEPDNSKPSNITDEWCLEYIVGNTMNTTCGVDGLWPTDAPTDAPTPQPTGLVAGLPQGQKAEDLIWLYLIFVVLFVIIAGGAYWYYRKKNSGVNGGKATFEHDVDSQNQNATTSY